jgi:RNA 3'-terminal phosphate cyclase-like protein
MLAPFAKKPLQLTLRGITTDDQDLSVRNSTILVYTALKFDIRQADLIRTVSLPHIQLFGILDGLELRVSLGIPE